MGREIRRVRDNWEHPREGEQYRPLLEDYHGMLEYIDKALHTFMDRVRMLNKKGQVKVYDEIFTNIQDLYDYEVSDGEFDIPNPDDYMPNGDWYQLFENVSEGTPLSPPFKTKGELIEWLSNNKDYWNNKWNKKNAEYIVNSGSVPSMIMTAGKLYRSNEIADIPKG